MLKRISFIFLLLGLTVLFSFDVPCSKEVPAAKIQIAKNRFVAQRIVREMKALDKELDKVILSLDKVSKSSGMEFGGISGGAGMAAQPTEDLGRVMQAEGIIAKARLNYLKACIARLQFEFSENMESALKKFDYEK